MTNASIVLPHLGSAELAEHVASRAEQSVLAYSSFLSERHFTGGPFRTRPVMDKANYLLPHRFDQLRGDDWRLTSTFFASSGSSGRSMYWPQLKSAQHHVTASLQSLLESGFGIHERRSLAIVGLALGSWIGGDYFSWALKNVAAAAPYPFCVFSPGSRHEEIVRVIADAGSLVDQVLLFVCPSAIGHLAELARSTGRDLPAAKLRYVVLGEPFPESMRAALRTRAGAPSVDPMVLSVYGSADTGLLGAESPASAAVRGLMHDHPDLARSLGIGPVLPHLFHLAAGDAFLESVEGELCITRWQGIPLVRYNLHDQISLLSWATLKRETLNHATRINDPRLSLLASASDNLPDILAVPGRADRSLILCGTNLTESMLDQAVHASGEWLTGVYSASIVYDGDRQRLAVEAELRQAVPHSPEIDREVYQRLRATLAAVQPEFHDDWQNVYARWDDDSERRIIKLTLTPWPGMSQRTAGQIKQRGIRT